MFTLPSSKCNDNPLCSQSDLMRKFFIGTKSIVPGKNIITKHITNYLLKWLINHMRTSEAAISLVWWWACIYQLHHLSITHIIITNPTSQAHIITHTLLIKQEGYWCSLKKRPKWQWKKVSFRWEKNLSKNINSKHIMLNYPSSAWC